MISVLAVLSLAIPAPTQAAKVFEVRREDMAVKVKVSGTVVPDGVFTLDAPIEGRVERVLASAHSWGGAKKPLAFLASRELAAMIDVKGSQSQSSLEERWQKAFQPTPVSCPAACFVLKVYAKARSWVKPRAVLFEAASRLQMVARVRPEDAQWVRNGQRLTFWTLKDPKSVHQTRVANFSLDGPDGGVETGASFALDLNPVHYFEPGTAWEGEVATVEFKRTLTVPTAALIRHGDSTYLPVLVSTGVTTEALTQVTAGVEDRREFLILDDARIKGAARHRLSVDHAALQRRRDELSTDRPAAEEDEELQPLRNPPRESDEKDYGEDPYGSP